MLLRDAAGVYTYRFGLRNCAAAPMSGFHVAFNKNALGVGLSIGDTSISTAPLQPGQSVQAAKVVSVMLDKVDGALGASLQIALKWTELAASAPFVMIQVILARRRNCHSCGVLRVAATDVSGACSKLVTGVLPAVDVCRIKFQQK